MRISEANQEASPYQTGAAQTGMTTPRIRANRQRIDNRYPGLGFIVQAGGLPYFEVLLTTDRSLFGSANAGRRNASNFYASRQDSGLIKAAEPDTIYLVPPAVIRSFAETHPSAIYYTLIAYGNRDGTSPAFAHAPETLAEDAPSVAVASDFRGHTLSTVLGIPTEKLKRVGGNNGHRRDDSVYGASELAKPDFDQDKVEGEDGHHRHAAGLPSDSYERWNADKAPSAGASDEGAQGNCRHNGSAVRDSSGARTSREMPDHENDAGFDYEDGYEDHGPVQSMPSVNASAQESVFPKGMQEPDPLYDYDQEDDRNPDDVGTSYGDEDTDDAPSFEGASAQAFDYAEGSYETGDYYQPEHGDGKAGAGAAAYYGDESELQFQALDQSQKEPFTVQERKRIIERIAPFESGSALYKAINADGEYEGKFNTHKRTHPAYKKYHIGLSYGIVQFTQDSGMLGLLLTMMRARDAGMFSQTFGPHADDLVKVTTAEGKSSSQVSGGRSARVQPVDGADLWRQPWIDRFRQAGNHVPFQAAQNELASSKYIDPMLQFAAWLGLDTERALAIIVDRGIQMGISGAKKWIIEAIGPIQTQSQRQKALAALGHADLKSFQKATTGLKVDGEWGPTTHAAMVSSLRDLGAASPIPIPARDQMMDAMVRRADGQAWTSRVSDLRKDPNFKDTVYQF